MKNFLAMLLILMPFCCYGQLNDDFSSDSAFSANSWRGDTAHFRLTSLGLQLYRSLTTTANYESHIAARVGTATVRSWEATAVLDFNPSAYNYARFYLLADSANLGAATEAWYVRLGGSKDEVALYRQQGTEHTLLLQADSLLSYTSYNQITVRAELADGRWSLYYYPADGEGYYLIGDAEGPASADSTYTGWMCCYTKTYAKKYYLQAVALSDELLEEEGGDEGNGDADSDDDDSGNPDDDDTDSGDADPDQADSRRPSAGDIVISEVMANPKGAATLPEAEYVELHNRTDSVRELEGCRFYYGTRSYLLPAYAIEGGGYVILCAEADSASFAASVPRLPLLSFPQLANSGKLLYIENSAGELLHWVEYDEAWYGSATLKKGGHSLEAVCIDRLFPAAANWSASTDPSGGTPGRANSIASDEATHLRPYLTRHAQQDDGSLAVAFSKSICPDSLSRVLTSADSLLSCSATDYPRNCTFTLTLPDDFITDYYSLRLDDLTDIDGLPLFDPGQLQFAPAATAEAGDLVINELLFNPDPEGGATFVELLSLTDEAIDLATLALAVLDADSTVSQRYPLASQPTLLEAGGYAVVTTDAGALFDRYGYGGTPRIIVPAAMPELDAASGHVALVDADDRLIDCLYYDASMHDASLAVAAGTSLERRNPAKPASLRGNWTSGNPATGYASPGYQNAAFGTAVGDDASRSELLGDDCFALASPRLSLGADPTCAELTLIYRLLEADVRLSATLYTASGLPAVRLVQGSTLSSSEGELAWGSAWRANRTKATGIYLLLVEWAAPSGRTAKVKMPVAIVP